MNTPRPNQDKPHRPAADDLAGRYLCVEGDEDLGIRHVQTSVLEARDTGRTADDLAGTVLCIEGDEDVSVRQRQDPVPGPRDDPAAADRAGIYVCIETDEDLRVRGRKLSSGQRSGERQYPQPDGSASKA